MKIQSATLLLVVTSLAACKQDAVSPNMTALDACKRADVKDKILTEVASAFVTKSGNLIALFGGPEAFDGASEDFKSRATIENPRVSDNSLADQKVYEVHCTVDLATVNSAKDNTPVEFRNVEFTIHYNNGTTDLGTEDYTVIPNKASFFRTVFVNGMSAADYNAQQQAADAAAQLNQEVSGALNTEEGDRETTSPDPASSAAAHDASDEAARAAADAAKEANGGI